MSRGDYTAGRSASNHRNDGNPLPGVPSASAASAASAGTGARAAAAANLGR